MQRPQSLEFQGVYKDKLHRVIPAIISYESQPPPMDNPAKILWPISIQPSRNINQKCCNIKSNPSCESKRNDTRYQTRSINLDQQLCIINRQINQNHFGTTQRFHSALPQSQSFNRNIYQSVTNNPARPITVGSGETSHTSRIVSTLYMSPPPADWATIGNVFPVKRSISMPGYRGANSINPNQTTIKSVNQNPGVTKKKSGPFQCLKHQLKKSGTKPETSARSNYNRENVNKSSASINSHKSHQINPIMSSSFQLPKSNSDKMKTSRSIFKRKPVTSPTIPPTMPVKPRGIKKSISLFFSSKSYRTAKSDPSNLDRNDKTNATSESTDKIAQQLEREFSFRSAARLNHSYESMFHDDDKTCSVSMYTDTNGSNNYTNDDDNSCVNYSNSAVDPGKTVGPIRTPSDSSLPDTASLSSSGHHIFACGGHNNQINSDQHSIAATSCHGNNNYRAGESSWKTVVGNVCRSNSKDSAIANSTLSADGMINQSKRMSQISTVSRTSDVTQISEDFNDSSYSSYNDLQVHVTQVYQKKRIKSLAPKLQPIGLESNQPEPLSSYDNSPFSDSSTETLRPLSCFLRCKLLASNKDNKLFHSCTMIKQCKHPNFKENLEQNSLRHSHSWPSCIYQSFCKSISSTKSVIKQSFNKSRIPNLLVTLKPQNHPQIKLEKLNPNRINNSPLLSQYSRLYSLKSAAIHQQFSLSNFSTHPISSTEPPLSPAKYSGRTYQHFPS